jgi:L-threonylcarbamoyladenylate synthase
MKTIVCRDKDSFDYLHRIKSGVVIYPADTIYGFGAYLDNVFTNKKIFELKKRFVQKPFIVLCSLDFVLKNAFVDETAINLLKLGATVILKNKATLPFYASKNGKTAYRLAFNPFIEKIVKKVPITSTSLNVSEKIPINSIRQILKHYFGAVDIIIIGKTKNIASSIVDFENKVILREGYNCESIKSFLGVL